MSETNRVPAAQARLLTLSRGLYSIQVLRRDTKAGDAEPAVCLAVPPAMGNAANEVSLAGAESNWQSMPLSGHVTFAQVRSRSGVILVGVTDIFETAADPFEVVVARLDAVSTQPPADQGVLTKIKLRFERLGWRYFPGKDWARSRNGHLRVLEIGLDAENTPPVPGIELRAFASGNLQTDWTGVGDTAGFAGADVYLTGFAARLASADAHASLSIGYSGQFKQAGTIGNCFDGKPCQSPISDDPLVGVSLWIGRRGTG
jgi:hypothetical protein